MSFLDDNQEEKQFELVECGEHTATLYDVEIDPDYTAKSSGDTFPMITMTWELANKRRLWQKLMFKDSTAWKVSKVVKSMGVKDEVKANVTDANDAKQVSESVFNTFRKLLGKSYLIDVTHREYNGKTYEDTEPLKAIDKVVQNMAPTKPQTKTGFDASEKIPF